MNLILNRGYGMQVWGHMECTSVRTMVKQTAQALQSVHGQYTDNLKQSGFQQESQGTSAQYIHTHTTHTHAHYFIW